MSPSRNKSTKLTIRKKFLSPSIKCNLQGVRIKINQNGDIFIKRLSKANIFVHQVQEHEATRLKGSHSSSDIYAINSGPSDFYGTVGLAPGMDYSRGGANSNSKQIAGDRKDKLIASSSSGASNSSSNVISHLINSQLSNDSANSKSRALELDQLTKVFDMERFKEALERESRRLHPNRSRLQNMCISVISFVLDDHKMLNLPSWIIIINIVALDLLRCEIGLADPRDFIGSNKANFNVLFPAHELKYEYDQDYEDEDLAHPYRKLNGLSTGNNNKKQLAASKRAFANAAALGAYNGDSFYKASTGPADDGYLIGFKSKFMGGRPTKGTNSDGELDCQSKQVNLEKENSNGEVQQSSSSSGFNSHCSSQNDSSAASSRSNIASNGESKVSDLIYTSNRDKPIKPSRFKQITSKSCVGLDDLCCSSPLPPLSRPKGNRGKRPPKLLHGIAQPSVNCSPAPIMSGPIPIPAPPTSGGGASSGKANLILVSPTGLSPPVSKRINFFERGAKTATSIPEFSTIKHIDENGQCKVLLDKKRAPTMPAGIPAHAQLAPPATQKHILRYLMSATELKNGLQRSKPRVMAPPPAPPSSARFQRPLPVLPFQRSVDPVCPFVAQPQTRIDESLYYCGLQARVPSRRPAILLHSHAKSAMSLDNLHHQSAPHGSQKSFPSFLGHVGGFLKRSKAKKSSVEHQDV